MSKSGKGLAAFALILGLIGAGVGGFIIVKDYFLVEEPYVLPMARVSCQSDYIFSILGV